MNPALTLSALGGAELAPLFWPPSRAAVHSAWITHVPFAHWLVTALRPTSIVELGTYSGVSYSAFCEAVQRGRLPCRCLAIDTWKGDEHTGPYGQDVFQSLQAFNTARYAGFSNLLRSTFDDALERVPDGSVDLLHIDGLHTYEAVRHDFESWRPKLSRRAVVLMHDTDVRERGFGVWRLFAELAGRYPGFEFLHGYGLGVLAVGTDRSPAIEALTGLPDGAAATLRERFAFLGERWLAPADGTGTAVPLYLDHDEPTRPAIPIEPGPDTAMQVVAEAEALPMLEYREGWHCYVLPGPVPRLRLVSRSFRPCDTNPALADRRRLGVAVWGIRVFTQGEVRQVNLSGGLLGTGWHPEEVAAGCPWRWTDGDAVLTLPDGAERIEIATTQRN